MEIVSHFLIFLAQADAPAGTPAGSPPPPSLISSFLPIVAILFMLYMFMVVRPNQKEQAAREDLLKNLKKNDQIITKFGVYGIVTIASPESEDVVIRLEDNAKLKLRKSAIEAVIVPTPAAVEEKKS